MALQVIGAGFGRTGTESLKAALERLGFGPCDHMFELIKSTWRVEHLEALQRGEAADLEALFDGFRSAVDFPFALYYRELADAYPDAKVVLTVRDPQAWYDSAKKTILRGLPAGGLALSRVVGLVSRTARGIPREPHWPRWSCAGAGGARTLRPDALPSEGMARLAAAPTLEGRCSTSRNSNSTPRPGRPGRF